MINRSLGIVAVSFLLVAPLVCYLCIKHDKVIQLMDGAALQSLYRYRSSSEGYYVICFDDNIDNITERTNYLQQLIPELKIRHVFPHLKAIAISTLSMKHLDYIQAVAKVTSIEPDYIVEAMRVQKLQNITMSWGIDRIDGKIDKKYQYEYTGKGVRVYIIDSGIKLNHDEFNTLSQNNTTKRRAKCGKNLRKDLGENCNDEWGHGTHVAAIVGT
jgi:Subtilase family